MTRYQSQDLVKELGQDPASIRKKTATIIGVGAIGSSVAELLARAGVSLRIIDKDRVYEHDLDKLSLFDESHIAKFKAKEAKTILEKMNKDIKIKAFHEELVKHNAYLVDSDVIIDCSNNLAAAFLAEDACKKVPLILVRASGTNAYLFIADQTRLKDAEPFLQKHLPERKDGPMLGTTARLAAALAANKALKILAGQHHEKNLLISDGWHFSFEKMPVRSAASSVPAKKGAAKRPALKAAKKTSAKPKGKK